MKNGFVVITDAPLTQEPRRFLVDADRFPFEANTFSEDLSKARRWRHNVAVRRWLKRHGGLPATCRRVWMPADAFAPGAASAEDPQQLPLLKGGAAKRPTSRPPGVGPATPVKSTSARRTKTDPNKRKSRAARLKAFRTLRRASGKSRTRKPARRSKVA